MRINSHIYIICSNEARNGKTLFARLYADTLSLSGRDRISIFDTDFPNGGIAKHFPEHTQIVDISKTAGQVKLFDTMIGEPGRNHLVDLQSQWLDKFFTIFHDIAFDVGAAEAGIGVVVFFMVDRSISSIEAAAAIRRKLRKSEFVAIRNAAIGNLLHIPSAARSYMRIEKDRDLLLPRLSDAASVYIERPGFTFTDFIARNGGDAPIEIRNELWDFLEIIYNQREAGSSGTTLLI